MLLRYLMLSFVACSLGCAATTPSSGDANGGPISSSSEPRFPGLPPAQAPLRLRASSELSMAEVMDRVARNSGQHLSMTDQTRVRLSQQRIQLPEDLTVPEGEVYSFIEAALIEGEFFLAPVKGGEVPVLGVYSGPSLQNAAPIQIELADVAAYAEHPALLVSTTVRLPHTDTRILQTQLRAKVTSIGVRSMTSVGRHGLLLCGTGTHVAEMVEFLLEIDQLNAQEG